MNVGLVLDSILATSLLSLGIIVAFTVNRPLRGALPFYDPIADWCGHGVPDIGMIYMVAVMAGMKEIIPFEWCVLLFCLLGLVFLVRIATGLSYVWWQDLLHSAGVGAKAWMFVPVSEWRIGITAVMILYFSGVIVLYVIRTRIELRKPDGISFGRGIFNLEHVSMSIAGILMYVLMQWPLIFPLAGGVLCRAPAGIEVP